MSYEEELLPDAVCEALAPVNHLEAEWESSKLEKRIRTYFRNAAKGLEFGVAPWQTLVNEYADKVFGSLFQALGDRPWLAQTDFLLCLDAGVKDTFPEQIIGRVPQALFERTVLGAHDRAFEEQRFTPILWDTTCAVVPEDKQRKKVYKVLDEGRGEVATQRGGLGTAAQNSAEVEDFVSQWIHAAVRKLAKSDDPANIIDQRMFIRLVKALIQNGALPLALVSEIGLPPDNWPIVDHMVAQAYATAGNDGPPLGLGGGGQGGFGAGRKGKAKGAGKGGNGKAPMYDEFFEGGAVAEELQSFQAPPPAKRGRFEAGGSQKTGNPNCTQAEDCVGGPNCRLFQHVDGEVRGDVYCDACWKVFAELDPSLQAVPYRPGM